MTAGTLQQRIQSLRQRLLVVGGLTGLAGGLIAAVVLGLAAMWLDLLWELTPNVRILTTDLSLTLGVAAVLLLFVRAWRDSPDVCLAQRLDQASGSGGQILSGLELSRRSPSATADAPLTAGLATMAVERAASLAATVQSRDAVSYRPLKRTATGLAALTAGVMALALLAPRLALTEWLRFSDPFGDHPPYSRIVFIVEPGAAQVLYGSGLDVQVRTEGPPVERVDLVLKTAESTTEETLPMFPEAGGRWRTTLTKVIAPGEYHVRAGRSRSHRFTIAIITIPRLEEVRVKVIPPAYTNRAPYQGPVPQGGLSGLQGARVEIRAKSNRPLAGGILELTQGGKRGDLRLEPLAANSNEVQGTFEIQAAGKFELGVTDIAGHPSTERLAGTITLLTDDKPFVRIRQPPPQSLATPDAMLPVTLAGEDDYGVARLELYRSLNESRGLAADVPTPKPALTRVDATDSLALAAYGLEPGDVITLFARVEDNDPSGAKGSESPLAEVRIISQEEFERMQRAKEGLEVLLSKYRQAQRRLDSLTEEQKGLRRKLKESKDGKPSAEARDDAKKLAKRLRREAAEIRKAAEHLLPYDLDKNLTKHLERLAESLEREAQAGEELSELESLSSEQLKQWLDNLEKQLEGEKQGLEKEALEPLAHLELIFPLIEDQARFTALHEQQRQLAERLSSLKGHDGEDRPALKGRMRDLEAEQRRVREALRELLDEIDDHLARLPEDKELDDLRNSAKEFVEAVRASGIEAAMSEAEDGLAEFSGTRGHAGAEKAADLMEEFIDKSSQVGQSASRCLKFKPSLGQMLGDTVAQLLGEAGLSPGGMGSGSGGYSTRRSTLNNMGLYGQMPGMDQAGGRSGQGAAGRGGSPEGTTPDQQTANIETAGALRAAGAGAASIPVKYRARVGAYFERIADEVQPAER